MYASEKCDGAIRVSKLEKFDKVKHQIKLVCQSDRNAVEREMAPPQNLDTSLLLLQNLR